MPENIPAFPTSPWALSANDGMSLRDYFAGQVIAGQFPKGICNALFTQTAEETATMMARQAYMFADAMMKQREAK